MPPVARIKVKGLDKAIKAFNDFDSYLLHDALSKGLDISSKFALVTLKQNTPVDSGNLRDSEEAVVNTRNMTALIGPELTKAHYAPFVEFGYTHYLSGRFIPGQHYIQKTSIEINKPIQEIFRQAINITLNKTFG